AQGNVYVTGYVDPINHVTDFAGPLTIKFDSNGAELWRAVVNTPNLIGFPFAVATDPDGNVYVVASLGYVSPGPDPSYLTIKYDASGTEQWRSNNHSLSGRLDLPVGIATDGLGNAYVTGWSYDSTTSEFYTIKFDAGGNSQELRTHGTL